MTNLSDIEKRCEACPFCGDDNLSVVEMTYMHADGPTKGQRIKCQTCGAQAPDTAWNLRSQVQDLQSKLATAEGLVALQQEQIGGMQRKVGERDEELETERLRLAACGVAAIGYFKGCDDKYRSASLDDVLRLREKAAKLEEALKDAVCALEVCGKNYDYVIDKARAALNTETTG